VADSFDAMTSVRPYRPALSVERALQELEDGKGTQFHPPAVDAFRAAFPETSALPVATPPVRPLHLPVPPPHALRGSIPPD
jgi:HD-GYP domain-containing protein (c-di-GMP phosphodiesterase class II)